MEVRYTRIIAPLLTLGLALATACDRGAHPVQVGQKAPDFNLSDGKTRIHLADYRGKVVLLNFWATWCAPCIQEMPSMEALHQDMPQLAMLAVSVDEDAEEYSSFVQRRHVSLTTVRDPSESAARLYHSEAWPETYVIDRQGVIRRKFIGAQEWESPEIMNYLKGL